MRTALLAIMLVQLLTACAEPSTRPSIPAPRQEVEQSTAASDPHSGSPAIIPSTPDNESAFGVNSHVASRYPVLGTMEQPLDVVSQLDVGWVREEVQWSRVEPTPGTFDWSWHDRAFSAYRRNGTKIIGIIYPAVGWATPEASDGQQELSFYPPDPDKYANFARAVAKHFKGTVQAWEIWNEPESPIFWRPQPDPQAYAEMLKKAYTAIKSVDTDVIVLNGGIVPYDPTFLDALATAGAWESFDALAVHPYVDPASPEQGQIGVVGVERVRQLADRYGSKPIWVTEYGWTSGPCERDPQGLTDEAEQANFLVRGAVLLRGAGAESVLWYNLKDDQRPCYGLMQPGSGPTDYSQFKSAASALRVLNQQVGSATPLGAQPVAQREVVLAFDEDRGWGVPYPSDKPGVTVMTDQIYAGSAAGMIRYQFDSENNDYVAIPHTEETILPSTVTGVGLWVYGDGSGHMIHVRIADEEGEVLQYRLGFIGTPGWEFLSTSITGPIEEGNRITTGNGRLDGSLQLRELVVDDDPNSATGSGVIYVDDLTVLLGPEVYDQRFQDGDDIVDVVWAVEQGSVVLPVIVNRVIVTDRDGSNRTIDATDGQIILEIGPAPLYVRQLGAASRTPP